MLAVLVVAAVVLALAAALTSLVVGHRRGSLQVRVGTYRPRRYRVSYGSRQTFGIRQTFGLRRRLRPVRSQDDDRRPEAGGDEPRSV